MAMGKGEHCWWKGKMVQLIWKWQLRFLKERKMSTSPVYFYKNSKICANVDFVRYL